MKLFDRLIITVREWSFGSSWKDAWYYSGQVVYGWRYHGKST